LPLDEESVIEQARLLLDTQRAERDRLDKVRRYWKGKQDLPLVVASSAPREVKTMAEIARVNVSDVIVESLTHSLFVEGLRIGRADENVPAWDVWQTNRFDRGQIGVHRAAVAYGTAYVVVTPGSFRDSDVPVLRGCSPRRLTALYGEDPDWPVFALEAWGKQTYRLYDDEAVYYLTETGSTDIKLLDTRLHGSGVCPVVRFRDAEDLDAEDDIEEAKDNIILGQVAPMMNLQDQINLTSFNLLIAQHYAAFRQRWIIGWTAEDENQKLAAAASRLWTFDDHPENVKVGEFGQTDLKGYIDSRETAIRYMATISQTPVHELIGELVNLSAEALAAAEAGKDRKVAERKTGFGESWEQVFQLVGDVPDDAEVRWRDTSARSFAATVDALGKLASLLGIPPRGLWEQIPGITEGDIKNWEKLAQEADSFARLETLLQGQATNEPEQPA
jgi:hypothetical protein